VTGQRDISTELGPPRDQGPRGTCLAFAVGAAHEMSRLRRRGEPRPELGAELLYWRCKQIDADGEDGTEPASAAQALLDPGQSADALWPYDGRRDARSVSYQPPLAALETAELRHATLSATGATATNIHGLVGAGHAVVLGIDLWPQFFTAHDGELSAPAPAELLGEGHAVTIVGFEQASEWLLIRNSWGESWGERGHARLPESALEIVAIGAWIVEDDIDG
jgi:C1A family cysteine protease